MGAKVPYGINLYQGVPLLSLQIKNNKDKPLKLQIQVRFVST